MYLKMKGLFLRALNLNDNIANQVIEILNLDRIIQKLKNGLEESCLDLELYLSTGEI